MSEKGKTSADPNDQISNEEEGFGTDFSEVRVHTGSKSVPLNKKLEEPFRQAPVIAFNQGTETDSGNEGKKLTHTKRSTRNIQ